MAPTIIYHAHATKPGDVQKIVITPTHKVRYFNRGLSSGPVRDHAWILWREAVPNLTDEEWYAQPSGDWTREELI